MEVPEQQCEYTLLASTHSIIVCTSPTLGNLTCCPTDMTQPWLEKCQRCSTLDENISQCDHCQFPYHLECLVVSPLWPDYHYCTQCISTLFPQQPSSPNHSNHPHAAGDSGLTKSSQTGSSDSEASKYEPKYAAQPMQSTLTPSAQSWRELRPRKK